MSKTAAFILSVFVTLQASGAIAAETDLVQIVPAVSVSPADLEVLKENNRLLEGNQQLVGQVLQKEGLEPLQPQLPKYHIMSANSVLALLNQLEYTALARKIGAPLPQRPALETGPALQNNRFLHDYNNEILRSVAKKLGVQTPAAVDLAHGSLAEQDNRLIKQNAEILNSIARKLGIAN